MIPLGYGSRSGDDQRAGNGQIDNAAGGPATRTRPFKRPQMAYHYGNPRPDIIELAAIYVHAICAHPFVDGNKRTTFSVCAVFLMQNGYVFEPPDY
jgi:death-on-curing family protein